MIHEKDIGCDHNRRAISGSGIHACRSTTDAKCMSGSVSEVGLRAGGLEACICSSPNCTRSGACFNDAAGAQPVNLYILKERFRDALSWQVTSGS